MNIVRRNSGSFPALLNDFFTREMFNWGESNYSNTGTTVPAVNIKESKDSFEVEVAAPGMKKEDFKIHLDNNLLTISSESRVEHEDDNNGEYSRKEFSYQSFQRSFTLPKEVVDSENIKAKYNDGVLKLSIPKREEAKQKPPRMIEIS